MSKTEKLIDLRTRFEISTTDEQIASIDAMPAADRDALLDLYIEASDLDPEADGPAISAIWGRIELAERAVGLL